MKEYDVLVVGAGPAGGQCARDLSKAGKKVLLIEKARDFSVNNYSSAGAPMELMHDFELPESVVGTYWNKIMMHSDNDKHVWTAPEAKGVIMDFKKLRAFLAEDSQKHGAEIQLGVAYHHHEQQNGKTVVSLKNHNTKEVETCIAKVIVDATGAERDVLAKGRYDKTKALVATGIEYLVEIDDDIYETWANALSIFMGLNWMPQGYAWIFPMEPNTLKVGVGRYFQYDTFVPHEKSYQYYLDGMMEKCLKTKTPRILDKHGKTLVYTYGRKDLHHENNVIAIGDTISTINPLAFEGIRHAMVSGQIAAKHINQFLSQISNLHGFRKEIRQYCGIRWLLSEIMMKKIYREADPKKIDLIIKVFKSFTMDEMIDLAFHYKLSHAFKFYLNHTVRAALFSLKSCF